MCGERRITSQFLLLNGTLIVNMSIYWSRTFPMNVSNDMRGKHIEQELARRALEVADSACAVLDVCCLL